MDEEPAEKSRKRDAKTLKLLIFTRKIGISRLKMCSVYNTNTTRSRSLKKERIYYVKFT